jgi:aminoglycoside 6'-N-acetyltransferase I
VEQGVKMKIRKATKKDFKEMALLINKEYSKKPYEEPWNIDDAKKTFNHFFTFGKIYVLVQKKIIGFIIFREEVYNGKNGFMIEDLVIDSNFQGKGLGRKLVEFVENLAKKHKIKGIWLLAFKKAPAYKFYKKIGYHQNKNVVLFSKEIK